MLKSHRSRTALSAVVLAGYLILVAPSAARGGGSFAVYYIAASLLAHQPSALARVYDDAWFATQLSQINPPGIYDIFFYNPPTMSLLMLPLVGFAPQPARLIWTLLGVVLLLGGLVLLARGLVLPARWGLWAMPLVLLYAPVTENLRAGQVYLLLFFLLCAAFWGLARSDDRRSTIDDPKRDAIVDRRSSIVSVRKSDVVAGLALGLMLALKFAGVWLWPLLLVAGRWRALAWAGVFGAGLALISLPFIGISAWRSFVALLPDSLTDPRRTVTAYQTVTSLFGHLLDHDARWNPAPLVDAPWAARALSLGVTFGALVLSARWVRRAEQSRPLGMALCMALVVTNAPFAEGYHYALTLGPLLVAGWWAWRARLGWRAWAMLALAALLLGAPLPYKAAQIQAGWWALAAYPRVYGAYLLWGWIAWALARSRAYRVELALSSDYQEE
jgi:glycosyl transferase family 87